ncbi:fimbrial protein [Rhodanobacter sp. Col0626]|uniref:fimbrial protein n=1 Tax=Rhodanobacter sp. Col0626 TaxID=3415679 RepID=UPI003CF343CD
MMRTTWLWITLLLLALVPAVASAKCQYSSGRATTVTFSLPTAINIPANMADGAIIATSVQATPANPPDITCGSIFGGETVSYGVVNSRGGYLADNVTYETGIPGLGYRITHPTSYLTPYPQNTENVTTTTFSVTSGLQLIKTGAIASGSVLAAGDLADWRWSTLYPETFRLGNTITFTTPSCTLVTDPTNVVLPTVSSSAFTGVGSTSGKKPFQILLSCPSGTAVKKITMHTASADSHAGVVAPTVGAGYALGVGVQVLDGNSNAVVFENQTVVTPNATTSIPYYAQYFQTAPTVSGGNVKATVTFDIFYQ